MMAFEGEAIPAKDIPYYIDEYFYSCLYRWNLTKMWGLAHGKGWAEEPMEYILVISALESEQNLMEKEEIDKKTASLNSKTSGKDGKKAD